MAVKKILCKLRNKLFLNAIRSCLTEIVRKETEPLKRMLSERIDYTIEQGATSLVHSYYGSENRGCLFHHRLLASPHTVQQKYGGTNIYVEDSDR